MWDLDYKESWALKNWYFWTMVLEKTLESPLDCNEIQPVCPKGDQSWMFIARIDAEAETPILWPADAKNWLIGKDPDAGKHWRGDGKGTTADEMVGWHHWLSDHVFVQALGVGDGQGSLTCCSPCGRKALDTTEWLNWTELTHNMLSLAFRSFPPLWFTSYIFSFFQSTDKLNQVIKNHVAKIVGFFFSSAIQP